MRNIIVKQSQRRMPCDLTLNVIRRRRMFYNINYVFSILNDLEFRL